MRSLPVVASLVALGAGVAILVIGVAQRSLALGLAGWVIGSIAIVALLALRGLRTR